MPVGEGEGLLPRQLRREPVRVGAGVAGEGARLSLHGKLPWEGEAEEGVHRPMRGGDKSPVDAVVHDLEEAVVGAGFSDAGHGRGGGLSIAAEETPEVDGRVVEAVAGGGVG